MSPKLIFLFLLLTTLIHAQESLINFENINIINKHVFVDSTSINMPQKKNGKNNLFYYRHILHGEHIYILLSNIDDFGSGFVVEKYELSSKKKIWQTTFDLRNTEFHHSPNYFFLNTQNEIEVLSFRRSGPLNPFVGWVESTLSIHKINATNGNIISHTFGDPIGHNITTLQNGFGFTKLRPTGQYYQYYYLGNLENPLESGCTFQEMNAQGEGLKKGAVNFNMDLEKFQFSSLYDKEITVFEYYLNSNDSNYRTYVSTFTQAWDKISKIEVDLKIDKPRSARLIQKILNHYEIETYVENDQKKEYNLIYLDSILNIVDEIKLPLSFQYNYASTVLNKNKGILLVRSIPVLEQGKTRCILKFYLSKGSEDKLIKESLVEGSNYFLPQELKELSNGNILLIGTYGEINEMDGSSKQGSTEQVALIFDIESIGITSTIDQKQKYDFKIVPNPVTRNFEINGNLQFDEVFIYSFNGELVNRRATNIETIEFSNFPRGFYVCELRSKGKILGRQKFVKTE